MESSQFSSNGNYIPTFVPISNSSSSENIIPDLPLPNNSSGRPHRPRNKPSYLKDYHYNLIKINACSDASSSKLNDCRYPLSEVINYDNLSSTCRAYTLSIYAQEEPRNYNESIKMVE